MSSIPPPEIIALWAAVSLAYVEWKKAHADPDPGPGPGPGPTPSTLDGDGFKKIYPSKTGANVSPEYYMRVPSAELQNWQSPPTINPDGSWRSREDQVRWERFSEPNKHWLNVEITTVQKVVKDYSLIWDDTYNPPPAKGGTCKDSAGNPAPCNNFGYMFQTYSRGGHHSQNNAAFKCSGSALKFALIKNGDLAARKEINHPAYCPLKGRTLATSKPVIGTTLGLKTIIYNKVVAGKTQTVQEAYISENPLKTDGKPNPTATWKKIFAVVDSGGWAVEPGRMATDFNPSCPPMSVDNPGPFRKPDEILSKSGSNSGHGDTTRNLVSIRADQVSFDLYYYNIREIVPPA